MGSQYRQLDMHLTGAQKVSCKDRKSWTWYAADLMYRFWLSSYMSRQLVEKLYGDCLLITNYGEPIFVTKKQSDCELPKQAARERACWRPAPQPPWPDIGTMRIGEVRAVRATFKKAPFTATGIKSRCSHHCPALARGFQLLLLSNGPWYCRHFLFWMRRLRCSVFRFML